MDHIPELYYLAASIVVFGGGFVVWRSTSSKITLDLLQQNNDVLKERVGLLEEDLAGTKAELANTQAELKVIKDLPLEKFATAYTEFAKSLKEITSTQVKILTLIEDIHRTRNDR